MDKETIKKYLIEKRPRTIQINDLVSLLCQDKDVVYTAVQTKEDMKAMTELCDKFGFKMLLMKEDGKNVFKEEHSDILIGTNLKRMNAAKKMFLNNKIIEWGVHLGYPDCCVKEYKIWKDNTFKGYYPLIKHIFSKTKKTENIPFWLNNITNFYSRIPNENYGTRDMLKKYIDDNMPFFEKGIALSHLLPGIHVHMTAKKV
ncbi:MAG: hypothetical protein K6357_07595 [Elusimicrobiota bacterium]